MHPYIHRFPFLLQLQPAKKMAGEISMSIFGSWLSPWLHQWYPPFCSWLSPWYPAWFLHVSVDLPWDLLGSWVYTSWLVPWAFLSGPCSRNASTSAAAWSWPRWFSSLDGFRWVKCLKWGQLGIWYLLFLSSYNTTNMFYHIWLHYKTHMLIWMILWMVTKSCTSW